MTIREANKRLKGFKIRKEVVDILKRDSGVINQLQQDQLYSGQTREGQAIRPIYASDQYARHKDIITPHPKRGYFTPNLYLTGRFYSTIWVKVSTNFLTIGTNDKLGRELEAKYYGIFGLNEESWKFYMDELLRPELMARFRSQVGF